MPGKYTEIVNLISNREMRLRIPVEELEILLEPIKSKKQMDDEQESDDEDNENKSANESDMQLSDDN